MAKQLARCAFRTTDGKCLVLEVEKYDKPRKCPFCKTKFEAEADRYKADRRLAALPKAMQDEIARKYYEGCKPWLK